MRRVLDRLPAHPSRESLRALQVLLWVLLFALLSHFEIQETVDIGGAVFNTDGQIDFDEATRFLDMADRAYLSLPPREFPAPTIEDVQLWVQELAPRFAQQGFADSEWAPDLTEFHDFGENRWQYQGQALCDEDTIWLNERFANPYADVVGTPEWLWTTAHEAAHQALQSCVPYLSDEAREFDPNSHKWRTESSASIAALEVLASMALAGNEHALYAFFYGLRNDVAFRAVVSAALRDNRRPELAETIDSTTDDPFFEYLGESVEQGVRFDILYFFDSLKTMRGYGMEVEEAILEARLDPFNRANGIVHLVPATGHLEQDRTHQLDATIILLQRWPEFSAWLNR